jgi:uncharacterized protein YbjT (DUF2867 family)
MGCSRHNDDKRRIPHRLYSRRMPSAAKRATENHARSSLLPYVRVYRLSVLHEFEHEQVQRTGIYLSGLTIADENRRMNPIGVRNES